jgi:hypothetical protein
MTPGSWLVVWDIIIGIWAAWFVALVVISITQSVWQSRARALSAEINSIGRSS